VQYTRKDITPVVEPVTIDMCKESLYLPDEPDETLLKMYCTTARRYIEDYTGTSLVPQEINVVHDAFTPKLTIPIHTDNNISISYRDAHGECEDVDNSDTFIVRNATPPYIMHKTGWPTTARVITLKYNSTVSPDLESLIPFMLLIVGHLYENRQIVDTKMGAINYLLAPFRKKYHV
jgi:hypothetical protein